MDPQYKTTVRNADQTVHGRLAKSRLATLLETVRKIGYDEIERMKQRVVDDATCGGKVVSLHTLMYRLGYNVNCIGIFGPQLDHIATRVMLQSFTEVHMGRYRRHRPCSLFRPPTISCCSPTATIELAYQKLERKNIP